MVKIKACKICKRIYDTDKCPDCGSRDFTDVVKGKIFVTNSEKSEIAKKLDIKKNGEFAIKVR